MRDLLEEWISVNSGTDNLDGLAVMCAMLKEAFAPLNASINQITLKPRLFVDEEGNTVDKPVGDALHFQKRGEVKRRVLLVGHMDTVFPASSDFKEACQIDANRLKGPGSADMKGGLVIMLEALKKFEASPHAELLGWDVIITPDEEVGSPSSKEFLMDMAKKALIGLIVEPSLPDGALVSARKGSATLSLIARGKAAHAGRDPHLGKNAINALAHLISKAVTLLHNPNEGTLLNFGHIQGGHTPNVVPDLAITKLNIRADSDVEEVIEKLKKLAKEEDVEVIINTLRPPKPFDKKTEKLFNAMKKCGEELGTTIKWQPSGGVCDGNFLAHVGCPTIDTIGAIGGNIHTTEEYIELDSLEKRSDLIAHFLIKVALGEIQL